MEMQAYLETDIHSVELFRAVMKTEHPLPSSAASPVPTVRCASHSHIASTSFSAKISPGFLPLTFACIVIRQRNSKEVWHWARRQI